MVLLIIRFGILHISFSLKNSQSSSSEETPTPYIYIDTFFFFPVACVSRLHLSVSQLRDINRVPVFSGYPCREAVCNT